jgi:signal transduction histidine kinase
LVNLLDNALKFTPAGGYVQIILQAEPAGENAEPGVRCLIEDSGPGIPAEYKGQIFDRFVRINAGGAQVRGTGLGLTFCKLALEAHGGRVWVEDGTEGGSRFVFIVPGVPLF